MASQEGATRADVQEYCRNRYVYGKLLDVFHFEMEQQYFNAKRWLLNRMVSGYGVVCGLGVELGPDQRSLVVSPGFALDKWGREVLVTAPTAPLPLPDAPPVDGGTHGVDCECGPDDVCPGWRTIFLCYRECLTNPVPVLDPECGDMAACSPGTICERYELDLREGRQPAIEVECPVPDLVAGGRVNYPALANYVSGSCPPWPDDPCIALASVKLPVTGEPVAPDAIDIAVRPIVYTNDLLHDLLVCLTGKGPGAEPRRGGKA
jgi:hypothetical protein